MIRFGDTWIGTYTWSPYFRFVSLQLCSSVQCKQQVQLACESAQHMVVSEPGWVRLTYQWLQKY